MLMELFFCLKGDGNMDWLAGIVLGFIMATVIFSGVDTVITTNISDIARMKCEKNSVTKIRFFTEISIYKYEISCSNGAKFKYGIDEFNRMTSDAL